MKNQHFKHLLELNIGIILISTSGVLGRSILLPPEITIWWRCLFAAFFIGIFCWYKKVNLKINSKKDFFSLLISGALLGAHWITYFYALKLSNVAIAMLSIFTHPVITALLEPVFFKTKLNKSQLLLCAIALVGISFLTPELNFDNTYTQGIAFGIASALFYSLRNIITKKNLTHYNASKVMFYQMFTILLISWPVLIENNLPSSNQWTWLLTLALLTTAIGHTLFVNSFKNFNVSTASIMSSMSPIYGILFGILFLSEIPEYKTIIGGILIFTTVVIEGINSRKR